MSDSPTMPELPALVLDFGGPVLLTPFELAVREPDGVTRDLFFEQGPLATTERPDRMWEDLRAGRLSEREYWNRKAAAWHRAGGSLPEVPAMFGALYSPPGPRMVRPQAEALLSDAIAAGRRTAILTNDMLAFHTQDWIDGMDIIHRVDTVVDGSVEGVLKPDPRLYEILSQRLGVAFADMVFVDDQPHNIEGALALGIPSVWFDVTGPQASFERARDLMGLREVAVDG